MDICDNRKQGTVISLCEADGTTVISDDDNLISTTVKEDCTVIENPTHTEVISLGCGQYLRGPDGEKGDAPEHQWEDTELRFRLPDGTWGRYVDLQGDQGERGERGKRGIQGVGIQGPDGPAGLDRYTWVKYAETNTPAPDEIFDEPDGMMYVGIASNRLVPEGDGDPDEFDYTQYKWSKILGQDGNDGNSIVGDTGPTGPAGQGFNWIGEFDDFPTEVDIGRPIADGDTFFMIPDGNCYTYAGGWHVFAQSGGAGPIGPQGAPGGGFQYQGAFDNAPTEPLLNWMYFNTNNEYYYLFDGVAWEYATSDGKNGPDGAEVGEGLRFFTSYHDAASAPTPPTLEGDNNGWNTDPNAFEPGTINWVVQKIAANPSQQAWGNPLDISGTGFRGPVGFRGSQSIMVPLDQWDGIWNDEIAGQACTGGAPQEWDVVTMYDINSPSIQLTKRWARNNQSSIWEWLDYQYVFLGDVLVDGTLDAQKVNVNTTLTVGTGNNVAKVSGEDTIRIAAGNANKAIAPFRVYQDGSVIIDKPPSNIDNGEVPEYDDSWLYPDRSNLSISGNYVAGVSGWAIDVNGNAEFNNGIFRGTVYVDKLEGDVVREEEVTLNFSRPTSDFYFSGYQNIITIPQYDHKIRVSFELVGHAFQGITTFPNTNSYGNEYQNRLIVNTASNALILLDASHSAYRTGYTPTIYSRATCEGVIPSAAPWVPNMGSPRQYRYHRDLSPGASTTDRTFRARIESSYAERNANNSALWFEEVQILVKWWKDES